MPEQLDDFDRSLRDRIGAAEARVPVASTAPAGGAVAPGPSRWLRPVLVAATAAVAVVLAVLVIGQLPDRSVGDATPSPSAGEGVSASVRNGDFVLTLASPRFMWSTEDAIEITATLSYDGDEPGVEIGGGGGPVVFSLVQLEGGNAVLGGAQDLPCLRYPLGPDAPLVRPFEKSGGVNDEPPFDRAFFEDAELHLPPGRWEVRAMLEYGVGDCGSEHLEVAIQLGVMEAAGPPGPSAVATEPPISSAPPPPAASLEPTTDVVWTVSAAFSGSGPSMVTQILAWDGELVAVGIAYDHQLPNVGPEPPHSARVWISRDGRSWEQVDLGEEFRNASLGRVMIVPDGSLLAIGHRYLEEAGEQLSVPEPAAWTSSDGRIWNRTSYPLLDLAAVVLGPGSRGYLASTGDTLWHSADARTWERALSFGEDEYMTDAAAGAEGFVVAGVGADDQVAVWASGDGRNWIEAASPPSGPIMQIGSVHGDWIAVQALESQAEGATWYSTNGLEWSPLGRADLEEIPLEGGVSCHEYPHYLAAAGPWLVMGTTLSYGCSEGGFVVHGTPQISLDGATWTRLPFEVGTPGVTRSGSAVNASATIGGNLILAGEQNGEATFWIGEPR